VSVGKLAGNVLQLQEVGDFEALNCLPPQNFISCTNVCIRTSAAIFF